MSKLKKGWMDLSIDQMVTADWNYKNNDPDMHKSLLNNIKRNGVIENLLVRELDTGFFEVVNGNHRLEVLKELSWSEKVKVYNFGSIPLSHAQRIAIETNETKFTSDPLKMSSILKDLVEDFGRDDLLDTIPFSEYDLDQYVKMSDFDFDAKDDISEHDDDDKPNKESSDITSFEVAKSVGKTFQKQLNRLKSILYDEPPESVSDDGAFLVISHILSKMSNKDFEKSIDELEGKK